MMFVSNRKIFSRARRTACFTTHIHIFTYGTKIRHPFRREDFLTRTYSSFARAVSLSPSRGKYLQKYRASTCFSALIRKSWPSGYQDITSDSDLFSFSAPQSFKQEHGKYSSFQLLTYFDQIFRDFAKYSGVKYSSMHSI